MITVTRQIGFDAGHRILNHEGKCRNLHGHRYLAEITCMATDTSNELDPLGRVIDFSLVKGMVGGWINAYWDHNMIFNRQDPVLRLALEQTMDWPEGLLGPKEPYVMECNPTAENMACELWRVAAGILLPPRHTGDPDKTVGDPQLLRGLHARRGGFAATLCPLGVYWHGLGPKDACRIDSVAGQNKDKQMANGILPVNEIFKTIQGEGPDIGKPCIFIRLHACPVQCPGCDTQLQLGTGVRVVRS